MGATKKKRRKRKAQGSGWWGSLDEDRRRRVWLGGGVFLLALAVMSVMVVAFDRVEVYVNRSLLGRSEPVLVFADLPSDLESLAEGDLRESVADLLERRWTDDRLCREMAERLSTVGWVARVHHVRRTGDARFEVSCRYRMPFAMVQRDNQFFLVDAEAERLPGVYRYDPSWQLVQGVAAPPPPPGAKWVGDDLEASLNVIDELSREAFAHQITAVLVGNYSGRHDPHAAHLELATDQAGGRIRWGSAPGDEVEENLVGQKLAILRENYRRTGRVDANHSIIDISVFPDRFTIPG